MKWTLHGSRNDIGLVAAACLVLLALAPADSAAQHAGGPSVTLERVAQGLVAPIDLTAPEDDTGRRFVVDQIGLVRILTREGRLLDAPFLDLTEEIVELKENYDERGLLGLAFHPAFAENGRFFAYYTVPLRARMPEGYDHANRLVEYRVSAADPNRAEPTPVNVLLEIPWPYSNHNGGQIAFGTDGYLYVPLGDGGNRDDEGRGHVPDWYEANAGGNGQDIEQNLLGSILRIDVNEVAQGQPYSIPADNPFVGRAGLDEIWAYGLRNPWRISFDPETGALFASDAGQELWEEVNIIVRGGNYGWNVREGTHCFDAEAPQHPPFDCPAEGALGEPLIDPIVEYDHYMGVVVVGGYPYRGTSIPAFSGRYIFADWSSDHDQPRGTLFVASPPETPGSMWDWEQLQVNASTGDTFHEYIRSFGLDADGEVYVLTSNVQGPTGSTGKVFKIVDGSMGSSGGHDHGGGEGGYQHGSGSATGRSGEQDESGHGVGPNTKVKGSEDGHQHDHGR